MATSGRPIDEHTKKGIHRLLKEGVSQRRIAALMQVDKKTVGKYAKVLQNPPLPQ